MRVILETVGGETVELDTDTYGELVERDKMTINLFFQEVYLTDKAPPKDKAKVKKVHAK